MPLQASSPLQASLGSSPTRSRAPATKRSWRRGTPKQGLRRGILPGLSCWRRHTTRLRRRRRLRMRSRPRSAQVDAIKHSCDYSFRSSVACEIDPGCTLRLELQVYPDSSRRVTVRITSSWTCEEAEVRDSRQQTQGFDSERCTSCRWCRYGPCGPPRPDPYGRASLCRRYGT